MNFRHPLALFSLGLWAANAPAHTFTFSLGSAAGATDYYGVICSTDGGASTDHLLLQIRSDTPNGPLVSAQVRKGAMATNTTDPVSGDAEYSPASQTRGGDGLYDVMINKTGPGTVVYTVVVHCLDASGTIHTGTDGVVYQDQ
ncbi:exported hypothetical protein [Gammaproteobacteria bacterium]